MSENLENSLSSKFTIDSSDKARMVEKAIHRAKSNHYKQIEVFHQGDYFFAGHQWSEEDEEYLRSKNRPIVTFNRILNVLLVVLGAEMAHRQDPLVIARNPTLPGQRELAETTTTYLRWMLDRCEGDDERSVAFFDLIRRGVGWLELSMAYDEDPDGELLIRRVDGLEMWVDPASHEPNYRDSRWRAHRKWMPAEEIVMLFGEEYLDKLSSAEFDPDEEPEEVVNVSPIGYAPGNAMRRAAGKHAGPYLVTHFQWWEWEEYYRTVDPDTIDATNPDKAKIISVPKGKWDRFAKMANAKGIQDPQRVSAYKKCFYQTFVAGDVELRTDKLRVPDFTFLPMTGLWDDKNHLYFGLVKPMKDPQEWANKFFSQTMDIMNRSRKNALLLRSGNVEDIRKFEDQINGAGATAEAQDITEAGVRELNSPQMPGGLQYLLESAVKAIPDMVGVNVELLGASEGDQPGITTQYRQNQGLMVLAPFFNAERRLRMKEHRLEIEYGRLYVADGRIVQLNPKDGPIALPMFRQQMAVDYDLILDENPHNPNLKLAMWMEMQPMLQVAIKGGLFALVAKIFDYAPYPSVIIEEAKKELMRLQQQKDQNPFAQQKGRGVPPNPMLDQAKIAKLQSASQVDMARARAIEAATRLKGISTGADIAGKAHQISQDRRRHMLDLARHHQDMRHNEQAHAMDLLSGAIDASNAANQPQGDA